MKRLDGIRAVSFDVGGTLIDPWPSIGHVYSAVAAEVGLPPFDPALLEAQFIAAWRAKPGFDYSLAAWADLVVRTFNRPPGEVGLNTVLFKRLYGRFTEARAWRIYEDVVPAIQELRGAGLQLAVASNWDDRLRPLLGTLGLRDYFAPIEVSGECGFHKPCPEIFARVVRGLGLVPEAVMHVGDSRREDYDAARAAGLRGVWLRRGHDGAPPDVVGSLTEMVQMLIEEVRPSRRQ